MKNRLLISLGVSALLVASASAQIAGSLHDLGFGADDFDNVSDNQQICVYCHTPHGSNAAFEGAPLWNKPSTGTTFTMYGTTVAGTAVTGVGGQPGGASLACLSCHDGTSAFNVVINAPGSGGYNPTVGTEIGKDRSMTDILKAVGSTDGGITNTLTNDHPISVVYTYTGSSLTSPANLKDPTTPITGWENASTINDLLRVGSDGIGRVECGSCHDPHLGQARTFLRAMSNDGSQMCFTCHDK